jgi:hypothetical protein
MEHCFISVHNDCNWSLFSSYPIYLQYILILVSIHTCILQVVYFFQVFWLRTISYMLWILIPYVHMNTHIHKHRVLLVK